MKTLILTVSAGQGHNSTANAVKTAFSADGNECKIIDIGYTANKIVGYGIDKGYLFSVRFFSGVYSRIYSKLLNRKKGRKDVTVQTAKYISKKLEEVILAYNPDVVICTHVFAGMVISDYIISGKLKAKTFGILTDFTLHPYWEETTELDYIVIPSDELADECIKRGYKEEQILPFGIPIQQKFSEVQLKSKARAMLELSDDKPVVALMSGSMCYGGVTETVKALDKLDADFQIIAVCGNAKKELKKLYKERFNHKVIKLGYTNKVNIVMDASDVIITKPGGLSTSEALSRYLPMILTHPIPGHEERNLEFISGLGAALSVTKEKPVDMALYEFLTDSSLSESMREAAMKLGKHCAAEKLFEFASK